MSCKCLLLFLFLSSSAFAQINSFKTTTSGIKYQIFRNPVTGENGLKPQPGDILFLNILYKDGKDSTIFDSKLQGNKIPVPLTNPSFVGAPEEIFAMLAAGDSAVFSVIADSLFLKTFGMKELPGQIPKGSLITFYISLDSITRKEELDRINEEEERIAAAEKAKNKLLEKEALEKFLADNKINTKPTSSGLIYLETLKGKGARAEKGKKAKMRYTGRLLDGGVFDTNIEQVARDNYIHQEGTIYEIFEFTIGNGEVIPGWEEAIPMMNAGGKATLIIPSHLGYGEISQGPIMPFSTLIFEVELLELE